MYSTISTQNNYGCGIREQLTQQSAIIVLEDNTVQNTQ